MPSESFVIKQGDSLPFLRRRLANEDGSAIDLSEAFQVLFLMRRFDAEQPSIEEQAIIIDPPPDPSPASTDPNVEYQWAIGDTETIGSYLAEFLVDFGGGITLHVPNGGYFQVKVIQNLGA